MIRVLLADDEALVRAGVRLLLNSEPDLEVVGEAEDGAAAVDLVRLLRPDVVLLDLRMKGMDGLTATRRILAADERTRIVVLTTYDADEQVFEALKLGVSGFLLKGSSPDQLVTAVRVVAGGDAMLEPSVTRRLITDYVRDHRHQPDARHLEALTEREREIMVQVGLGRSNAEIAEAMAISLTTVKSHVRSILAKLSLRDRTQIAVTAFRSGLMDG